MKTAIVTDSIADIPQDLADRYQITIIPAILTLNGESYLDGSGLSRVDFYAQLPSLRALPTTAAPSIEAFQQAYDILFTRGIQRIISIHVAGNLSGIFSIATTAAKAFGNRIHMVDSRQVTLGLGFQALAAAETLAKGLPIEAALDAIRRVSERVRIFAMLDTLDYIRRSGRVGWATSFLGNILSLKPLIELYRGEVFRRGFSRLRKQGLEYLRSCLKSFGVMERLALLHTGTTDPHEIPELVSQFNPMVQSEILTVHVTTVIGTHVGPNGLGFAAVPAVSG